MQVSCPSSRLPGGQSGRRSLNLRVEVNYSWYSLADKFGQVILHCPVTVSHLAADKFRLAMNVRPLCGKISQTRTAGAGKAISQMEGNEMITFDLRYHKQTASYVQESFVISYMPQSYRSYSLIT